MQDCEIVNKKLPSNLFDDSDDSSDTSDKGTEAELLFGRKSTGQKTSDRRIHFNTVQESEKDIKQDENQCKTIENIDPNVRRKIRSHRSFSGSSVAAPIPLFRNKSEQSQSKMNNISTKPKRNSVSSTATGNNIPRKGLFETNGMEEDDIEEQSLESFHEQVKQRQKHREEELNSMKLEIEQLTHKVAEMDEKFATENKEKETLAIRLDECQRIVEKRNKQLMKASQRVARYAEQMETQTSTLQNKVADISIQLEQKKTEALVAQEKLKAQESQIERLLEIQKNLESQNAKVKDDLSERTHELSSSKHLVINLQDQVEKYKNEVSELQKNLENSEAISRGLKHQIEREQLEKAYIQQKFMVLQPQRNRSGFFNENDSASSNAYLPSKMNESPLSPTTGSMKRFAAFTTKSNSSISSTADLSLFDLFPPTSATQQPTDKDLEDTISSESTILQDSKNDDNSHNAKYTAVPDNQKVPASMETTNSRISVNQDASLDTTSMERETGNSGIAATTINFLEKLSLKKLMKRSSLNNVSGKSNVEASEHKNINEEESSDGEYLASFKSNERPRMYVANIQSHLDNEESSDSIFSSESSEDESSGILSDDEVGKGSPSAVKRKNKQEPPLPPPPPPLNDSTIDDSGVQSQDNVLEPPIIFSVEGVKITQRKAATDAEIYSDDGSLDSRRSSEARRAKRKTSGSTRKVEKKPSVGKASKGQKSMGGTSESDSSSDFSSDSDSSLSGSDSDPQPPAPPVDNFVGHNRGNSHTDVEIQNSEINENLESEGVFDNAIDHEDSWESKSKKKSGKDKKRRKDKSSKLSGDEAGRAGVGQTRMNEYMEKQAARRQAKLDKKNAKKTEKIKKMTEYEKEWEILAQEEKERKRKQQQQRRSGARRPSSMKTVRVSQMRQQRDLNLQRPGAFNANINLPQNSTVNFPPNVERRASNTSVTETDADAQKQDTANSDNTTTVPLPPQPTTVDPDLFVRQQARLKERHDMQMQKKAEAEQADLIRGEIHRRVENWAFGKELMHMILTLDQISTIEALRASQLSVAQTPDAATVRKAYRNIIRVIHPDKLRGATIAEQLEAKELFTQLNQAFEKFKDTLEN